MKDKIIAFLVVLVGSSLLAFSQGRVEDVEVFDFSNLPTDTLTATSGRYTAYVTDSVSVHVERWDSTTVKVDLITLSQSGIPLDTLSVLTTTNTITATASVATFHLGPSNQWFKIQMSYASENTDSSKRQASRARVYFIRYAIKEN